MRVKVIALGQMFDTGIMPTDCWALSMLEQAEKFP